MLDEHQIVRNPDIAMIQIGDIIESDFSELHLNKRNKYTDIFQLDLLLSHQKRFNYHKNKKICWNSF